ncbi:hypothetical protein HDU87_005640 [Geranomyces variabilis]|uniref:2Fe-2S ferredoxin-type domain-containing protein n=1 Tax=Geranomyces variabilis TaxID=109894 RepID=A0AAD5TGK5_9FUNG|nr:hypothetical protein HDU87_005640 [Geranomyces variabilis]
MLSVRTISAVRGMRRLLLSSRVALPHALGLSRPVTSPALALAVRGLSATPARLGKKDKMEKKGDHTEDLPTHVASSGFYKKHVLVATGTTHWDKKVEESDPYFARLSEVLKKHDIRTIACDAPNAATDPSARSLLVLPDNIEFPSVSPPDFASLATQLTSARSVLKSSPATHKTHILVCVHGARDCRCGDIGRPLYEALKAEVQRKGLESRIQIRAVSHVGGHKLAGNAIVYPSGDWYGLMQANDAGTLLDAVVQDEVIWNKWRGRIAMHKEEQTELYLAASKAGTHQQAAPTSAAGETVEMTFILPNDTEKTFQMPLGASLMEVGRDNEMPNIEGTCGGNLECATCHVIVDPAFAEKLPPVSEEEEDMLEYAIGRTPNSRLSCQLTATREINGLRVMIPTAVPRKFPSMADYRLSWQADPQSSQRLQQRAYSSPASTTIPPSTAGSAPPPPPPPPPPPKRDFKSLMREYGPIATGVYLSLSFLTFCACLTSIVVLGIDEAQIKRWFALVRSAVGFPPAVDAKPVAEVAEDATSEPTFWAKITPEWMRSPTTRHAITTVLLAMGMTKLFMPVKLGITVAITPFVAKKLRSFGFQLGQKGGYKTAATQIRTEVKERAAKRHAQ